MIIVYKRNRKRESQRERKREIESQRDKERERRQETHSNPGGILTPISWCCVVPSVCYELARPGHIVYVNWAQSFILYWWWAPGIFQCVGERGEGWGFSILLYYCILAITLLFFLYIFILFTPLLSIFDYSVLFLNVFIFLYSFSLIFLHASLVLSVKNSFFLYFSHTFLSILYLSIYFFQ